MAEEVQRPTLKRKSEYLKAVEVTGEKPGRDSWTDNDIIGYQSLLLEVLSDDDMMREVNIFLNGIQNEMSPRAAASALILTWNMRSTEPIETRIFPEIDAGAALEDWNVEAFERVGNYTDVDVESMLSKIDAFEARRAGAFLAASTLKMFAKETSSWTKAWDDNHIQTRYKNFTKVQFPFDGISPNNKCMEELAENYQGHKIFLGTLGRILYALAEVTDTRQTSMLFDQHLSFTGLHIIQQFINAKLGMGAKTSDLLSALDMKQNTDTLILLMKLINNHLSKPITPDNRGTFRFARLFDQNAFIQLQTKYAQDTVGILANINKLCKKTDEKSDPMKIAVLRNMGVTRMRTLRKVAELIHHYFTVTERAYENEFFNIDKFALFRDDEEDEEEETPAN